MGAIGKGDAAKTRYFTGDIVHRAFCFFYTIYYVLDRVK